MSARMFNRKKEGILNRQVASLVIALAAAVSGCNNGSNGNGNGDMAGNGGGGGGVLPPVASTLTLARGDGPAGPLRGTLALPLVGRVSADDHRPVPSVTVAWAVGAGGGAVAGASSTTDADGLASIMATLGSAAGDNTFTATVSGLSGSPVTFHATAKPAANLAIVSGDGQSGTAGAMLAQPLVVKVTDGYGSAVSGIGVAWTVTAGGGSVSAATVSTGPDGTASVTATLGPVAQGDVFQAAVSGLNGSPAQFSAMRNAFKLVYTNPAAGGKLRLVKNAASTDSTVVLDFVAAQALTGWATGFNLPLDNSKVKLNATPLTVGTGLNAGASPAAAKLTLPSSGPLKSMLVSGVSQKAAGTGSSAGDATIAAGTVLYTIKLDIVGTAPTGTVFDGTAGGFTLPSGGMRDKQNNAVAGPTDVKIGKLAITQ